ncbi:hypothetical protein psal_cds_606 [Pandoravirus salinus]|uniref:Uncharacterized protein n=1 Tax=Pandoravirus salinus TaxID=1349410 RepID=S4VV68_9VIRU|nr:hypothetical protein psal_cds_606 [Pandoravirus salinus]AGO84479.2 hypothetical protein psal_cds_606 [Pandoravirus salinus]
MDGADATSAKSRSPTEKREQCRQRRKVATRQSVTTARRTRAPLPASCQMKKEKQRPFCGRHERPGSIIHRDGSARIYALPPPFKCACVYSRQRGTMGGGKVPVLYAPFSHRIFM